MGVLDKNTRLVVVGFTTETKSTGKSDRTSFLLCQINPSFRFIALIQKSPKFVIQDKKVCRCDQIAQLEFQHRHDVYY